MRRNYELTLVFRVLGSEDEQKQVLDQVISWIEEDDNGKVISIDRNRLGRRKLAYLIDKQREGVYIIIYAKIEPQHLPELELNLKLSSSVLRYLIIRADEMPETKATEHAPATSVETDEETADSAPEKQEEQTKEDTEEIVTDAVAVETEETTEEDVDKTESAPKPEEEKQDVGEAIAQPENLLEARHLREVGSAMIQHFNERGWYTYQDLVDAGVEAIAEISGISATTAQQIYDDARTMLDTAVET